MEQAKNIGKEDNGYREHHSKLGGKGAGVPCRNAGRIDSACSRYAGDGGHRLAYTDNESIIDPHAAFGFLPFLQPVGYGEDGSVENKHGADDSGVLAEADKVTVGG